ncbi:MAG: hypothetical protein MUC83_05250 [Pirellula sp.]|jgi:hypothetical protein|nr:hypothetical protein [Pirellula sp.]
MFHPTKGRLRQLSLGLCLAYSAASSPLSADEWTNSAGSKSITGEFVKLDGVKLTIRKEDGTEATIPLYLLNDASRLRARALAKGDKTGAMAADMTNEPLKSVEVMSLSDVEAKFASMKTAEEFVKFIQAESVKGNYVIQWDQFPPSMQIDAENLAKEAIGKLEQPALDDILKFKKLVVETFKSKKSYLLNSKELGLPPEIKPLVELLYDPVVELVSEAVPDSYFKLETLKKTELRDILTTVVSNVAPRLENIFSKLPPGMNPKDAMTQMSDAAKFNQISDTEAQLTVINPLGGEITQTLVRVDNRWIEKTMFESMKAGIEQAKPTVQALDSKQLTRSIRQGLLAMNAAFGGLANAESQQDVDDIIKLLKSNMPQNPGGMGIPGLAP